MTRLKEIFDRLPISRTVLYLMAVGWGFLSGVFALSGLIMGPPLSRVSIPVWIITVLLADRSRSVVMVALTTFTALLTFLFLPVQGGKSVAANNPGIEFWEKSGRNFVWCVILPVAITWVLRWVIQHLINWNHKRRHRTDAPAGMANPRATRTTVLLVMAVPWGLLTGAIAPQIIYIGPVLWMASILIWTITVLLVDRPRSVALVLLNTLTALLTFLFLPGEVGAPSDADWSSWQFWKFFGFAFPWFVLLPIGVTWVLRWMIQCVIHWIRKGRVESERNKAL